MTTPMGWLLGYEAPRCGCAGECGRTHAAAGCEVTHPAALVVEPRDPAATALTPLSLPAEQMGVWCSDCHAMAAAEAAARTRLQVLVDATCPKPALGSRLRAHEEGHSERGAAA